MRGTPVGRDVKLHQPRRDQLDAGPDGPAGPFEILRGCHAAGLDGVLIRTIIELSPTLDAGLLRAARATADELGLYLELGVGKVNPYMTAELPEVRDLGQGDYAAGMTAMIAAAADAGCHELWTATAFQKSARYGIHAVDRFRTDVTWEEQLRATTAFIQRLGPALRDSSSRLNLETHEEITAADLARVIDVVGADIVGVTFDPANCVARGEDPLQVVRALGPSIRQTHLRDVALFADGGDVLRYLAPCGEGVLDWDVLVAALLDANANLNLSIEGAGAHRGRLSIPRSHPRWVGDRGLVPGASDPLEAFLLTYDERVRAGRALPRDRFEQSDSEALGDINAFVAKSAAAVRASAARYQAGNSVTST
jgi:sugar phosphate isomerase/epimerase